MKVSLITFTPEPEKVVATAAKLCYSKVGIDDLTSGMSNDDAVKFVERLGLLGHESPLEHISFTFGIEGVSRALLAQITRHRIASYSVQSQRYVNMKDFKFVIPPAIASDIDAKSIFLDAMKTQAEDYMALCELLTEDHMERFLDEGLTEKEAKAKAEKLANEDARFILPNACETKMVVTMNARSLQHFFALRLCNRAQWEIRELAEKMLALVYPIAPSIFKNAGPGCVSAGHCTEGRMCCGKQDTRREQIKNIKSITSPDVHSMPTTE